MTPEPDGPLHAILIARLIPLLTVPGLSGAAAAAAAKQMLAAYQTQSADQLLAAAQTIAFTLAAIDSLGLSAAPELSLPMKLRLQGNANALSRSSQRGTPTPESRRQPPEQAKPQPPPDQPRPVQSSEQERKATWATSMINLAAECTRNLGKIPPEYRPAEAARIAALTEAARRLTTPRQNKSALLGSTSLGR